MLPSWSLSPVLDILPVVTIFRRICSPVPSSISTHLVCTCVGICLPYLFGSSIATRHDPSSIAPHAPPLLRIARIRIRTIRFDNRVSLATLPTTNLTTTTPHHTPHQHPHTLRRAHHLTSTLGRNLFTLHRLHATSFTRDTYNPFKLAIPARLDSESYTPSHDLIE